MRASVTSSDRRTLNVMYLYVTSRVLTTTKLGGRKTGESAVAKTEKGRDKAGGGGGGGEGVINAWNTGVDT